MYFQTKTLQLWEICKKYWETDPLDVAPLPANNAITFSGITAFPENLNPGHPTYMITA